MNRDLLIESVREHLLPIFFEQGFVIAKRRITAKVVDREYADSFPFDELRRSKPDGGVDLIEIQFKSRQRAAFRINATAVPRGGMMTAGGHRTVEELHGGGLHDHFETHARPWLRPLLSVIGLEPLGAWFSLWQWPLRPLKKADYEGLALRVASIVPEIELALSDNKLGPHLRRVLIRPLPPEVLERIENQKA